MTKEQQIEQDLIARLQDLKYTYRSDIRDKASLEQNFRKKFEALNRVNLSDAEFNRLREEIITADVFLAAQALREKGKFTREDGTPLEYMLVNLKDWCKNDFEVISQLRINTDNSHHRYDVIRAAIKKRKVFPTDDSVRKVIYLAIQSASKKWSMPIQNWRLAMSRFIIEFGDRLSDHL